MTSVDEDTSATATAMATAATATVGSDDGESCGAVVSQLLVALPGPSDDTGSTLAAAASLTALVRLHNSLTVSQLSLISSAKPLSNSTPALCAPGCQ